jgi:glutamate N-acetyltransferase / amino-acid N-acetyltransferase
MEFPKTQFPLGFRTTVGKAGLKGEGIPDCALLVSELPCQAAALFTRNRVVAAPVTLGRELLAAHQADQLDVRGVFINSKNANAVTGEPGLRDARQTADWLKEAVGGHCFVMSTGVIGQPMPMDKIERGLRESLTRFVAGYNEPEQFAKAIMTTDTVPKFSQASFQVGSKTCHLAGFAKGAGMIHPDMATMLSVICCDANISQNVLQDYLREAADQSFHCTTVDGDTSTNDSLLLLANNGAETAELSADELLNFKLALNQVCRDLAIAIAFDGEGARHHITLEVEGTQSHLEARTMGRVILTSPLVKTAIYGRDANWGRILAAAGRSGIEFDPSLASLWLGGVQLLKDGLPLAFDEVRAKEILTETAVSLRLVVGAGTGRATLWSCDLTEEYIAVNADYRT